MSQRELRSIIAEGNRSVTPRLRSRAHSNLEHSRSASESENDPVDWRVKYLEAERRCEELLRQNESTLHELREQIETVSEDRDACKRELQSVSAECESLKLQSELERLRATEQLRDAYERRLAEERAQIEKEKQRADAWIFGLKESNLCEKRSYEDRILRLEAELVARKSANKATDDEVGGVDEATTKERNECDGPIEYNCSQGGQVSSHASCISANESETRSKGESECGSPSVGGHYVTKTVVPMLFPPSRGPPPLVSLPQVSLTDTQRPPVVASAQSNSVATPGRSATTLSTEPQSSVVNVGVKPTYSPASANSQENCTSAAPLISSQGLRSVTSQEPFLVQSMAKLLEAQTQMLAAQAQAATVQILPPLAKFNGEDADKEEKSFKRWLDIFEERAKLAAWSAEQKLYQLKMHLEKYALQVFHVMPEEERKSYTTVVNKLKERFRSVDIEELKGIEFHQKMQTQESVEQLGTDLLDLGRKAFPKAVGPEFDRILKGRFFQALHRKWQRKLGAPI